jgi:hypothetical protein
MQDALNLAYTQYAIPTTVFLTSELYSVYLAVKNGSTYSLIKVPSSNWTFQTGNKITLNNQDALNMALNNKVLFIPKAAFNLYFTGITNTMINSIRPVWLKRTDATKSYDYLSVTSINYLGIFSTIYEFANTQFSNGVGTGFSNLTSDFIGMYLDFNGKRAGMITAINSTTSLTINSTYNSSGLSRSFIYLQGSLDFSLDTSPPVWSKHLDLPLVDSDIAFKFLVRDTQLVTDVTTTYPGNAIRILGTEYLL